MRGIRLAGAIALGLATAGCNAGRAWIASPTDYADYRRVRLGATVDDRISAAWSYLKAHADGRYADEIRGFVERAEPLYFRVRGRNAAGLAAYVAALPDGPRAAEALDTLMVIRNEDRREPLEERAARATRLRVEYEQRARQTVATTVESWTRALAEPSAWRGAFVEAPPALLAGFRLVPSPPECTSTEEGQRCTKHVHRVYRVRGSDAEVDRRFDLTVELALDAAYRLESVRLSGENLALAIDQAASGAVAGERGAADEAWRELLSRIGTALPAGEKGCRAAGDASGGWRASCETPAIAFVASRTSDGREAIEVKRLKGRTTGSTTRGHER